MRIQARLAADRSGGSGIICHQSGGDGSTWAHGFFIDRATTRARGAGGPHMYILPRLHQTEKKVLPVDCDLPGLCFIWGRGMYWFLREIDVVCEVVPSGCAVFLPTDFLTGFAHA